MSFLLWPSLSYSLQVIYDSNRNHGSQNLPSHGHHNKEDGSKASSQSTWQQTFIEDHLAYHGISQSCHNKSNSKCFQMHRIAQDEINLNKSNLRINNNKCFIRWLHITIMPHEWQQTFWHSGNLLQLSKLDEYCVKNINVYCCLAIGLQLVYSISYLYTHYFD